MSTSSSLQKTYGWQRSLLLRLIVVGIVTCGPALALAQRGSGGGRSAGGGGGSRMGGGGGRSIGGGSSRSGGNFGGGSRSSGGGISRGGSSMRASPGPSISTGRSSSSPGRSSWAAPGSGPSVSRGSSSSNSRSLAPSSSAVPKNSPSNSNIPNRVSGGDRAGKAGGPSSLAGRPGSAGSRSAGSQAAGNQGAKGTAAVAGKASSAARASKGATSWKSLSQGQRQQVRSNLTSAVKSPAGAQRNQSGNTGAARVANPQRAAALASQGNVVRSNWNQGRNNQCFRNNWWVGRSFIGIGPYGWYGGFGYSPWLNYYPWSYWWGRPSWNSCVAFLPSYGWGSGYYYDYGPGGNVTYGSGQVAVDGQVVGTDAEYAQSAAELASVDAEELKAVSPADWMALGTFSMAVTDNEVDPARVVQLAVSKNGLISGTIHNRTSGNTYTVQGRVDKETQRLAFTIGEDRNTVLETGIYNLTQDETPVLCHFSTSRTQTYMLVRLPEPEQKPEEPSEAAPPRAADAPPPPPAADDR